MLAPPFRRGRPRRRGALNPLEENPLKIHEYQAKEVLRRFGVATPRGRVTDRPEEAREICEQWGGRCVVKAQIHAGGRGKGGGVKLAGSPAEAEELARRIVGMRLVTPQTGPEGQEVRRVLVEEALDIDRELYLSVTLDRAAGKPVIMASRQGGMDIEEVAAREPEAIVRQHFDPFLGLLPFEARRVVSALGLEGGTAKQATKLIAALARAYVETDASLVEINPLLVTGGGDVLALDAKMSFDDNALFRHADLAEMRDLAEEARPRSRRRSTGSTTSSSTATSAAWSTAPGWRWRRWTSSSCTAASRRTSSTSAARRRRRRWPTPSASWSPTRRSRRC
jgi:succinyl-CoA synthetase beta subunit